MLHHIINYYQKLHKRYKLSEIKRYISYYENLIYQTALFAYVNTLYFSNIRPTCTKISQPRYRHRHRALFLY